MAPRPDLKFLLDRYVDRLADVIVTVWVGALLTVGWMVAPTLFATLADRVLAGQIAGALFRNVAWLSLAAGLLLLWLRWRQGRKLTDAAVWMPLAMLACTLVGYFGLQPIMADLRVQAAGQAVMDGDLRWRFGLVHGASSAIYLIESLLGLALVWRRRGAAVAHE